MSVAIRPPKKQHLSSYGETDTVEEEPVNDLEDIELDELEDDDKDLFVFRIMTQ